MVLQGPWVLVPSSRRLEPLASLDTILAKSHKGNHSLWIKPTSVVDRLQEMTVHPIDLISRLNKTDKYEFTKYIPVQDVGMLFCSPLWLINGFEAHQTTLASQFRPNLQPQFVELVLNLFRIGTTGCKIEPLP